MDFVKYEPADNDSLRIINCSDCSKYCDDTSEQSLKRQLSKATGG